jgi:hypothetical protein
MPKAKKREEQKTYLFCHGDEGAIAGALIYKNLKDPSSATILSGSKFDMDIARLYKKKFGKNLSSIANSIIYIADLSLSKNQGYLGGLLKNGNEIFYFDHHMLNKGQKIPQNQHFHGYFDKKDEKCTTMLVADHYYKGSSKEDIGAKKWAIAGAFGDCKDKKAIELAKELGLDKKELKYLNRFGRILTYHSFGPIVDPEKLVKHFSTLGSPDELKGDQIADKIARNYLRDMKKIKGQYKVRYADDKYHILVLPKKSKASRKLFASVADTISKIHPNKIVAVASKRLKEPKTYSVSIRADHNAYLYAERIGGGGRETAAAGHIEKGKNETEKDVIRRIINKFEEVK